MSCACGCGQETRLAPQSHTKLGYTKGQPIPYVPGHQNRHRGPRYLVEDRGFDSPCWIWQLQIQGGYGRMNSRENSALAHRFFYEIKHGPIPGGLQLDHLCRVRACVNPAHLEPVTNAENQRRGSRAKLNAVIGEVRLLIRQGWQFSDIANAYGVNKGTIGRVAAGRTWR